MDTVKDGYTIISVNEFLNIKHDFFMADIGYVVIPCTTLSNGWIFPHCLLNYESGNHLVIMNSNISECFKSNYCFNNINTALDICKKINRKKITEVKDIIQNSSNFTLKERIELLNKIQEDIINLDKNIDKQFIK